jgi:glycosyltransferase involved in cell wall biosynthesis
MQVSVLIPVYNAAPYVRQAVESALAQAETAEVVLVEDASPDDSLAVCQSLVVEYPDRVRLFRHPGGENRGAGASRNLAIEKSRYPFIAFLDADDYFMPERFAVTKRVFEEKPYVDGVYEAVGGIVESEAVRKRLQDQNITGFVDKPYTTSEPLEGDALRLAFLTGQVNEFNHIGLTLKREAAERVGGYSTTLKLHQDSHFTFRLICTAYLAPGEQTNAVTIYRFHEANRWSAKRTPEDILHHRLLMGREIVVWAVEHIEREYIPYTIFRYLASYRITYCGQIHTSPLQRALCIRMQLIELSLRYPSILLSGRYWLRLLGFPVDAIPRRVKSTIKRLTAPHPTHRSS